MKFSLGRQLAIILGVLVFITTGGSLIWFFRSGDSGGIPGAPKVAGAMPQQAGVTSTGQDASVPPAQEKTAKYASENYSEKMASLTGDGRIIFMRKFFKPNADLELSEDAMEYLGLRGRQAEFHKALGDFKAAMQTTLRQGIKVTQPPGDPERRPRITIAANPKAGQKILQSFKDRMAAMCGSEKSEELFLHYPPLHSYGDCLRNEYRLEFFEDRGEKDAANRLQAVCQIYTGKPGASAIYSGTVNELSKTFGVDLSRWAK